MHRQFPRNVGEELMDKEQSYRWLKFVDIKGETGSTVVAALGHSVRTTLRKNSERRN